MKKHLFALLALVLLVCGCPSNAPQVDASDFALDAAIDAAPHRLGSFNPTCTSNGVPRVVSGVQQPACSLGSANQVLTTNAGATDVTWTTPAGGSTPTGTGFSHVTAGALDVASKKVDLTAAADVTVPATANGVVTSSGTALQQATNVLAGSSFVSIGATPATTGALRLANNTIISSRDVGNANDISLLTLSSGNTITLGANGTSGADVRINMPNTGTFYLATGVYVLAITQSGFATGVPINGGGGATVVSAYGVHGKTTVATAPPFTLAAADYAMDAIMLSNAGAGTVTFPDPASDNPGAYYKTVINTGAGTKTLSNGHTSTPTLATNLGGRYLSDMAGMHLVGTATTYP